MYYDILSFAAKQINESILINKYTYTINKSSMDTNQEIISRLKFISKVKKGEKLNTRYLCVQPDGLGTSISRTFMYKDSRANALNFIQETINRAFELLVTYERSANDADNVLFSNLVIDLHNSTIGLANLKDVYSMDTKFCCDMDTILEYINAKLSKFPKKINECNNIQTYMPNPVIENTSASVSTTPLISATQTPSVVANASVHTHQSIFK